MNKRILLADDEPTIRAALSQFITDLGYEAVTACDGVEARALLASSPFALCLTDMRMSGADGFAVIKAACARVPAVPVVVLTGQGTVKDAVSALRAGAVDFLSKPVSLEFLERSLRDNVEHSAGGSAWKPADGAALVGDHPAIRQVLERVEQVADTDANILIRGETGTGKEIVARLIHASSPRRGAAFVPVNMAAIPDELAESELFGHARGAFTGADRARAGKILAAENGTLFLDEIGDMPKHLQGKLLRVLQEREVQAVGASAPVNVNVRIIAATHRNLEEMVREGAFREDLYYRLDVIPIELPALRERKEDLPALVDHFRTQMNVRHARTVTHFEADVMERLADYDWPGNVRQLQNVVERLVIVASGRSVTIADLPINLRTNVFDLTSSNLELPACGVDLRMLLSQLEDRLIGQALKRTGGNKNRAAELLGLNRTTLVEKLRRRNVA